MSPRSSADIDTVIPSASLASITAVGLVRPASMRLTTDFDTPARLAKSDSEICCTSRVALIVEPMLWATRRAVLALLARSVAVRTTARAVPSADGRLDVTGVAMLCLV